MLATVKRMMRGVKYGLYKRYIYPWTYAQQGNLWLRKTVFSLLNHQPRIIKLHVNHACNLYCSGCYSRPTNSVLSKSDILRLLDQICSGHAARPLRLDLLGGEPLLRKDLDEIIAYAGHEKKITPVFLYTNATLCDESRAVALQKAGLDAVIVTLHAADAQAHDALTTVAGSWEKTVAGIRALVKAGIRTYTFTIITPRNIDTLDQIDSFARQLGTKTIFHRYMPQSAEDHLCVRNIDGYQRSVAWMHGQSRSHTEKVYRLAWWRGKICPAFVGLVNIQADGAVTPCPFVKKIVLGNVREMPLYRILQDAYMHTALQEFLSVPEDCSACVFKTQCAGGCKAGGYAIGSSALDKDMYCRGPYMGTSIKNEPEKCIPYFY